MPDQPGSSSNSSLNIPSFDQVEKQRAEQAKKAKEALSFFKPKGSINNSSNSSPTANLTSDSTINKDVSTPTASTARLTSPSQPLQSNHPSPAANSFNHPRSNVNPSLPPTTTLKRSLGNAILINPSQQKNPILKHIRNVTWEPSEAIKVDYTVGQTTGVIYLSLKYHRLYPTYIYDRLATVKNLYVARILLVHVDIETYHDAIREINRLAILSDFTLMLAWSPEEAGRYLETYKALEHKAPDLIRERVEDEYFAKMTSCLTHVKSVNKTDVLTLVSTFGSLKNVVEAKADQLAMCPGFGEQKAKQLQQAWKQPFLANKRQKRN